jgi:bacteriorhodopsin
MELQIKAIVAGILFGIWPLMMNRSGLAGNMSAVVMTGVSLICVTPFALSNMGNLANANWFMGIGAGVVAAIGIMSFNGMLAKATPQNVSALFVMMIVVQTVLPAVYNILMNGGMTLTKGAGFVFAIIAAVLLTI